MKMNRRARLAAPHARSCAIPRCCSARAKSSARLSLRVRRTDAAPSAVQLASAIGLPGIPTTARGAMIAEICVETAGVRYTDDGVTTPTASVGIPVVPSSTTPTCFQYAGPLSSFKVILDQRLADDGYPPTTTRIEPWPSRRTRPRGASLRSTPRRGY